MAGDLTRTKVSVQTPLRVRFSGRFVRIIVGPENQEWTIHERLLCNASDYFADALAGPSYEEAIFLPEHNSDVFTLFVDWLYQSNLARPPVFQIEHCDDLSKFLKLAIMANKFLVPDLENGAIAAIYIYLKDNDVSHPDVKLEFAQVSYVFNHTNPGSGLRRLLCHHILAHLFEGSFRDPEVKEDWEYHLQKDQEIAAELFNAQFERFISHRGRLFPFRLAELSSYQLQPFDEM
ncbi:hypothetical protein B0H67DRAFT_557632 [Lasiosphaeris hirsuta]|uniref:BTB domain-containing protein n=1 Tax=Lasiosphaeris hirsuta TaxID=260670 RepID=A0AA39ZWG8_9PEZI|nr:hypothetical protein B0H67DRAFT_557632 [Lasiosphaeris hirsuta]